MDRRDFLGKATALSVGFLAVLRGGKAWAKGLPSDPGGASGGISSKESIVLSPFEKDRNFTLDRALLERKLAVPLWIGLFPEKSCHDFSGPPRESTGRMGIGPYLRGREISCRRPSGIAGRCVPV